MFGRGTFYQSCPELKIKGQKRSTAKRFDTYKLDKIVNNKSKVLDIGCNCGFFSLTIARKSKIVHSIEPNKTLIKVANITKKHLQIKNCFFFLMIPLMPIKQIIGLILNLFICSS